MAPTLLQTLLSNLWIFVLVVLFFGGSIFVHELGHFLAARRRGAVVERFSIGFGPAIFKWRGKDNIEYRISWFPLGGYVLLPQLADLGAVEGESHVDVRNLPPVSYATRMIVFVMGATFNVIFAFLLATIVWIIGQPVASEITSTTVAEVLPTLKTSEGKEVTSPASEAGLRVADVVVAIDGKPVATFEDIREQLALSSGWSNGQRQTVFKVRRGPETLDLVMKPVLGGDEKLRQVGFRPATKFIVEETTPDSDAQKSGVRANDQILEVDAKPVLTVQHLGDALRGAMGKTVPVVVRRDGRDQTLQLAVPTLPKEAQNAISIIIKAGISLKSGIIYAHPTPWRQISDNVNRTFTTLWSLVNPRSDLNFTHVSGPIGIIDNFIAVARADVRLLLWFTILVNVNLAIFNLLPIPVLDGGHMLFATLARLRGRPLSPNFVATAHSVFFVLLFSMIIYVSVFDVRRKVREVQAERAAVEAAAKQKAAPPAAEPAK